MAGTKLSDRDEKYLETNFIYHSPTPRTIPLYIGIRAAGKALARMLLTLLPESRERSTALTHLESALFWANACVARNPDRLPPATVVVSGTDEKPDIELMNLPPLAPSPAPDTMVPETAQVS